MFKIKKLKKELDIVKVVGDYVELKKVGKSYKALCPFHNEKTASFTVTQEKQIFKCFGCGESGDVIHFVQKYEKMEFVEAVEFLVEKAGLDLKDFILKNTYSYKKDIKKINISKKIIKINKTANKFFQKNLEKSQKSKQYLKDRGVSKKAIKEFDIGYAPNSYYKLVSCLKEKFDMKDIQKTGLIAGGSNGDYYSFFRDRIIFPIRNKKNEIIAFAGRAIDENQKPKYLNIAENAIYNKSKVLYSGKNKEFVQSGEPVVVVEGYMDVISAFQAGIDARGVCGCVLTKRQLKEIQRYTDNIVLAFDNDEAGLKATKKSLSLAYENNIFPKVLEFKTNDKDIDELVKNNNIEEIDIYDSKYCSVIDGFEFFLKRTIQDIGIQSAYDRQKVIKNTFSLLANIKLSTERFYFIKKMSEKLPVSYESLAIQFKTFCRKSNIKIDYDIDISLFGKIDILSFMSSHNQTIDRMTKNAYSRLNSKDITEAEIKFFLLLEILKYKFNIETKKILEQINESMSILEFCGLNRLEDFRKESKLKKFKKMKDTLNLKMLANLKE